MKNLSGETQVRFAPHVTFFLLGGVFLLKLVVPVILALSMVLLLIGAVTVRSRRMSATTVLVGANYALWLTSGFLVGALALSDMVAPEFFQGDGRVLLSYLPLLLFGALTIPSVDLFRSAKVVGWLGWASLALFGVWVIARPEFISEGTASNFAGFLTSHSGAGTFYGILGVFLTVFGHVSGRKSFLILGLLLFLPVFGTASRATLVAVVAVAAWFARRTRRRRTFVAILMLLPVSVGVMAVISPHTFARSQVLFTPQLIAQISRQVKESSWSPGEEREIEGVYYNVLSRFLFWTYAVHRIQQSPLLGIGFGRWNDADLVMEGVEGVAYFAMDGTKRIAAANAHNSYLHVAVENGLLGLLLLTGLWLHLYRRLGRDPPEELDADHAAFLIACQALILFVCTAALFGHSLASPSASLPITLLVGQGIAARPLTFASTTSPDDATDAPGLSVPRS